MLFVVCWYRLASAALLGCLPSKLPQVRCSQLCALRRSSRLLCRQTLCKQAAH